MDRRQKDVMWFTCDESGRQYTDCSAALLAVAMDIRDELKRLNWVFACPNFIAIPHVLRGIRRNTAKPKPKRRKKPRAAKEGGANG